MQACSRHLTVFTITVVWEPPGRLTSSMGRAYHHANMPLDVRITYHLQAGKKFVLCSLKVLFSYLDADLVSFIATWTHHTELKSCSTASLWKFCMWSRVYLQSKVARRESGPSSCIPRGHCGASLETHYASGTTFTDGCWGKSRSEQTPKRVLCLGSNANFNYRRYCVVQHALHAFCNDVNCRTRHCLQISWLTWWTQFGTSANSASQNRA